MDCTAREVLNQSIPYRPEFPATLSCGWIRSSGLSAWRPGSAPSTTWTRDQKRQCKSRTNAPPFHGRRRCMGWAGPLRESGLNGLIYWVSMAVQKETNRVGRALSADKRKKNKDIYLYGPPNNASSFHHPFFFSNLLVRPKTKFSYMCGLPSVSST